MNHNNLRLIHAAHVLEARRSHESPPATYRPYARPRVEPDYSFFCGLAVALGFMFIVGLFVWAMGWLG